VLRDYTSDELGYVTKVVDLPEARLAAARQRHCPAQWTHLGVENVTAGRRW